MSDALSPKQQTELYSDIAVGMVNYGSDAPANGKSITDKKVTFDKPFSSIPYVVVSINSTTINPNYGSLLAFVADVSETGFRLRVANSTNEILYPGVYWVAIAK